MLVNLCKRNINDTSALLSKYDLVTNFDVQVLQKPIAKIFFFHPISQQQVRVEEEKKKRARNEKISHNGFTLKTKPPRVQRTNENNDDTRYSTQWDFNFEHIGVNSCKDCVRRRRNEKKPRR